MKKQLLSIAIICLSLTACQKQTDDLLPATTSEATTLNAKKEATVRTEKLNSLWWNECAQEYILLQGTLIYTYANIFDDAGNHSIYLDINYDSVIGTGQISGDIYYSKGGLTATVDANADNTDVKSKEKIKVVYKSASGHELLITETIHAIIKDGDVKLSMYEDSIACQ